MGLTQIVAGPDNRYARFEAANGVTLSIHVGEGTAGGTTTYLESGALDAWVAYLARRGVRFDRMPQDQERGWREARLTDPAGNRHGLYQDRKSLVTGKSVSGAVKFGGTRKI